MKGKRSEPRLDERLIATIRKRLQDDLRIRRKLPAGGWIQIDRQLPFLVVYRPPPDRKDAGTRRFVQAEASYLVAPRDRRYRPQVQRLVQTVAETLAEIFGGFLVVEIWTGRLPSPEANEGDEAPAPGFRVVTSRNGARTPSVERLRRGLERVKIDGRSAEVEVAPGGVLSPPGQRLLLPAAEARKLRTTLLGVEVRPSYQDPVTGDEFPLVTRRIDRLLSRALQEAFFEFARNETSIRPQHYQVLGRRAVVKAIWDIDRRLAEVADSFDLLLMVTPTNTETAWRAFQRDHYERAPQFSYRPVPVDPALLKRSLFNVPIERVEDPTLEFVFREKRRELDAQISLLFERNTARFLPTTLTLYGTPEPDLVQLARDILGQVPPRRQRGGGPQVNAEMFAARGREEIGLYARSIPKLDAKVEIRDDISSLMVSGGHLFVGKHMAFTDERAEALIHHEIGTHVVTYYNGKAQPFRLLASGLAGYEELQEGLAVFAEYLVGGLTGGRMRVLAGRVLAAAMLIDGAEFIDTFRQLRDAHGFPRRTAFMVTMRVFRGGGFVKDAVYLRGLARVLDYIDGRGHIETLLVGKIATEHAPIVEELQRRRILQPPPLRPTYLEDPDALTRLDRARSGLTVRALLEGRDS